MNQSKVTIIIVGMIYAVLTMICFCKPAEEYSFSERRKLAKKPELSAESISSGNYMSQTEAYVTDQFPFRDTWRAIKANISMDLLGKTDINGIYEEDGYLCAMEYPMDKESIVRAGAIFTGIYERYLQGTEAKIYCAVIPDKSYFLAEGKYLSMDYEQFFEEIYGQMDFAKPIEIQKYLALSDYYRTDTHWKQEEIVDVAKLLAEKMGTAISGEYRVETVELPFYGVYYGQAALKMEPDTLRYCTNDVLKQCKGYDYENNREIGVYDVSKAAGRDPYEMFFGGNISLAEITNPKADTDKELLVFGDSFARSLLPLMAEGYAKITLVDIRYLPSSYIGNYVTFSNQDVLFLYSTSVLNNSITLK